MYQVLYFHSESRQWVEFGASYKSWNAADRMAKRIVDNGFSTFVRKAS